MTKLFAIIACLVFSLGIIVSSVGTLNHSVTKDGGLKDRTVSWIENSVPQQSN